MVSFSTLMVPSAQNMQCWGISAAAQHQFNPEERKNIETISLKIEIIKEILEYIIFQHETWQAIKKAIKAVTRENDIYRSICWPFYDFSMELWLAPLSKQS